MESEYKFLGIKVPRRMLTDLKRRAREDGRTLSGYVRRLLSDALGHVR